MSQVRLLLSFLLSLSSASVHSGLMYGPEVPVEEPLPTVSEVSPGAFVMGKPDSKKVAQAVQSTQSVSPAAASILPVTRNILAIKVQFPGLTAQSCTQAEMESILFGTSNSVKRYFEEMSRETTTIQGIVHATPVDLPSLPNCGDSANLWYQLHNMVLQAKNVVSSRKVSVAGYDHFVLFMPSGTCIPGMGQQIQGNSGQIVARELFIGGDSCKSLPVVGHEFGHAIGLNHATITNKQYPTASEEYGDTSDLMGFSNYPTKGLNVINKLKLGYLTDAEVKTVLADGQAHTIGPVSTPLVDAGVPLALRFEDLQLSAPIFLSYRQPFGFDANLSYSFQSTLSVHSLNPYVRSKSWLIANIGVSQSLQTPNGSVITLQSISGTTAVVRITGAGGQAPVNQPPTVNAGANKFLVLPATVSLSGAATDPQGGALSHNWSKVKGPGTVSFSNSTALATSASFSVPGLYLLRLTSSDGSLSSSDDVLVIVSPERALMSL